MDKKRIRQIVITYAIALVAITLMIYNTPYFEMVILAGVVIAVLFISRYAPTITGLSEDNIKVKFYRKAGFVIILLLSVYVFCERYISSIETEYFDTKRFMALFGCLLIIIGGNYAPKIPHNPYLGFRLPWSVRDKDTWNYLHRLCGKLSFVFGLIMMVMVVFIDPNIVMPGGIISIIVICSIKSYLYYKRKEEN